MSDVDALAKLLEAAFSPDELRDWLHDREGYLFFQALPDEDSILHAAAAATLYRLGKADAGLFQGLREHRPALAVGISKVAADFDVRLSGLAPAGAGLMRGEGLASPEPEFSDPGTRDLSIRIEALYDERERAVVAGRDPDSIDERILALRRSIRQGPQLHAGEFLGDGRYKLIERVGQGGWGSVWKAYDRHEHELVAVKVLHGHWSGERSRRERFARGASAMAQLQHQGVVRVLQEAQEEGGFHWFVMELLRGGDLYQAVRKGALDPERCIDALLTVADALAAAHERGLVHRDVKPHNILLDSRGRARLTDFDLVKDFDYSGSHTGSAMGTYRYAAPELLEDAKSADARADIYGLGMTAAFCLSGKDPPREAVNDPTAYVQSLPVGEGLRGVLCLAVAHDADGRWPDMRSFRGALDAARDDLERGPERGTLLQQLVAELAELPPGEPVPIELTEKAEALEAAWHPEALRLHLGLERVELLHAAPPLQVARGWDAEGQRFLLTWPLPGVLLAPRGHRLLQLGDQFYKRFLDDRRGRRWVLPVEVPPERPLVHRMPLPEHEVRTLLGSVEGDWRAALERAKALCALAEDALSLDVLSMPLRPDTLLWDKGYLTLIHLALPPVAFSHPEDPEGEANYAAAEEDAERAYVYRVGRLLHALLLGRSPPAPGQWQDELSGFPKPVEMLVFRATAQEPEARIPTLKALEAELEAALRWSPTSASEPLVGTPSGGEPPSLWSGWPLRAAAALLVVGISAGVLYPWGNVDVPGDRRGELEGQARTLLAEIEAADQEYARTEQRLTALALATHAEELDRSATGRVEAEGPEAAIQDDVFALQEDLDAAEARARTLREDLDGVSRALITVGGDAASFQPATFSVGASPEAAPLRLGPPRFPTEARWPALRVVRGAQAEHLGVPLALPEFAVTEGLITRGQYERVMSGGVVPDAEAPYKGMSFCDALRFANALSDRDGLQRAYVGVPVQGCADLDGLRWSLEAQGYRLLTLEEGAALRDAEPAPACAGTWLWDAEGEQRRALAPDGADAAILVPPTPDSHGPWLGLCLARSAPEAWFGALRTPEEATAKRTYVVRPGDNLSRISQKFYGTTKRWQDIQAANAETLRGGTELLKGMELVIPE
ncbi:MAG: protein kinase [Alphaproteobacteria bacterium]|nr:protein kinase [Alphaproteobacteria bacterium]